MFDFSIAASMRSHLRCTKLFFLIIFGGAGYSSHAELLESVIKLRAQVSNAYGKQIDQEFVVTVFEDDAIKKPLKPVAIVLHGRAADAAKRLTMGPVTYKANAKWLAEMGFVVAVPTRIGYGETAGEDAEDSGTCSGKNYPPAYQAAAEQALIVMQQLRQRSDVDKDRMLVVGQSFGGATAITLAGMNPPGLKAAINFSGGGGGNPVTQPGQPCAPYRLEKMFAQYGKTARIPTLWIYTENDQWMGAKYPSTWYQAYLESGGQGKFVQFGPNGKDGHGLFTQAPEVWRPVVKEFLKQQGVIEND